MSESEISDAVPTPWDRVLEKLEVIEHSKKSSALYETQKFITL
jgi:hypothetical protein